MINHYGMYNNPLLGNQPLQNMQQSQHEERLWVQNETAAEAYLVAPNGFVRLWDSQKPVFYEKRADANGRPYPMEAFEYKRRTAPEPMPANLPPNDLEDRLEALTKRIEALENKKGAKANAKQQPDANDTSV